MAESHHWHSYDGLAPHRPFAAMPRHATPRTKPRQPPHPQREASRATPLDHTPCARLSASTKIDVILTSRQSDRHSASLTNLCYCTLVAEIPAYSRGGREEGEEGTERGREERKGEEGCRRGKGAAQPSRQPTDTKTNSWLRRNLSYFPQLF